MNSTIDLGPSRYQASTRSRYAAAVLSALVGIGLLFVLLSMAALTDQGRRMGAAVLTAMNLSPPPGAKSPKPQQAQKQQKPVTVPQQVAPSAPKILPHVEVNNPNKVEWPEGFIHTSHAEMAAGDIGRIHSAPADPGAGSSDGGGGGHGGGAGQGGQSWYNVEWYRKPPHSVFDNYMRPGQQTGRLAEIDCRMIDNFHVEDCHEVREEPRGTGMARVMREAAWQFLVRPPRLNGKPLLGTRVRITYTFTDHTEEVGD